MDYEGYIILTLLIIFCGYLAQEEINKLRKDFDKKIGDLNYQLSELRNECDSLRNKDSW